MADSNKSVEVVTSVAERFRRRDILAENEIVELMQCVAQQVATLHAAGRVHRAIGLTAVEFQENDRPRLAPPPLPIEFGGLLADIDACPPELQDQPTITLSPSIEDASRKLGDQSISMAPQRVDVYQLGVLLCRLLTGGGVASYLHSAKFKRLIPNKLQAVIDAALGYDPSVRHQTVDEFIRSLELSARDTSADGDTDPHNLRKNRDTDSMSSGAGDSPPPGSGDRHLSADVPDEVLPFQRLGHYEILDRIGHGGMGDVYKGYERALDRVVAIKVLPAEFARQPEFVARFRAEAAAVASLTHPNVIQIHFIGEDHGHHFFAMQYVDGETLGQRMHRRGRLDVDESMSIVEQVLAGLSAAHRRGIVHRDIKPANVLLDRVNRRALVADFGLVKSIGGGDKMTATGVVMGTVDYISPEQGRGLTVDARSDLYSVGVLAYQLLSGRLPFEADSPTAMIFQHVYEQPKPLRGIVSKVPGPLCAVVEKLLAKSPEQRYQTAEEVLAVLSKIRTGKAGPAASQDVGADGPKTAIIQAPRFDVPLLPEEFEQDFPQGWWQRTRQQWVDRLRRRQPAFVKRLQNTQQQVDGALAEYEERRQNLQQLVTEANDVLDELRRNEVDYRTAAQSAQGRAQEAIDDREAKAALQEKAECLRCADELAAPIAEQQSQLESMQLKLAQIRATLDKVRSQRDLLNARLNLAQARTALAAERPKRTVAQIAIRAVGLAGIGTTILVMVMYFWPNAAPKDVTGPKTALVKSIGNAGEIVIKSEGDVQCIALAPSRRMGTNFVFATGNSDGSFDLFNNFSQRNFNLPVRFTGHLQPYRYIAFSPDGKLFATANEDGAIDIWDVRSNQRSRELRRIEGHEASASRIQFSPDGTQLLIGNRGSLRLWDVVRAQEIHSLSSGLGWIETMDWSRDGRHVLIGLRLNGGNSLELANLYDESERIIFDTDKQRTDAVSFSRLEDQAISLRRRSIVVNDIRTKELIRKFGANIRSAAFSPASHRVWTANDGHQLCLWDLRTGTPLESYIGHTDTIVALAISTDGSQGYSASRDGTTRIWDLPPAPPPINQLKELACGGPIACVAFSPDGYSALASSPDDLTLWELDTSSVARKYGIKSQIPSAVFAADGQSIVYGAGRQDSKLGYVGIRDVTNRLPQDKRKLEGHEGQVTSVAMSRDLRHAVSGGRDGTVRVWNVERGTEVEQLKVGEPVNAVEFSRKGDLVLIGSNGNHLRLWKWDSSKEVTQLEGHSFRILGLSLSGDGSRVATASGDRTVRIWDLATGQVVAILSGHSGPVNSVALSEHGLVAISGGSDATVRLWDVASAKEIQRFEGHIGDVRSVALSRDGTRGLSGGDDGMLRVWQLPVIIQ